MPHRTSIRFRAAVVVSAVAALQLVGATVGAGGAFAAGAAYVVSPSGSDSNPGTVGQPFKTLQKALDVAQPGTTITLTAGTYTEAVTTKVAGTATAPITIKGPESGKAMSGRYKAVLYGLGSRVFSINHSYYTLDGFTIDGQKNIARTEYPTSLAQVRAFKDGVQSRAVNSKLIYVGASDTSHDIVGTTISNMFLNGSGGECVRFRNRAANSLVVDSVVQWCGMLGQGDDSDQYKYHNAEGVYIGTSPKSTTQPMYANDTSNAIVVRRSTVNTFGSECFEVKENANHNRIEDSDCGFNDEPLSFQGSNIELRGDHNTVFNTKVSNSRSWNLKLASDSSTYDRGGNTAQGSAFSGAAAPAIVNRQTGSGPFCGNTFTGTISVGNSIGDPRTPCADTTPAATTINPTALFEAEAGTVTAGMTVTTDSTASGGRSVVARSSGGTATYAIAIPTAGRYAIAGWIKAANPSSDSFSVKVDSAAPVTWNLTQPTTAWSYDNGSNPVFTMSVGNHTLQLQYREANAAVDRLVLVRQ